MKIIRHKKQVKSDVAKKRGVSLSNLGIGTLITSFAYLTLISYTWPMGFVPIVSLESLPIVLLGFIIFSVALIGVSIAISFPVSLPAYHFFKLRKEGASLKEVCFWKTLCTSIWASLFEIVTIKGHAFMTSLYMLGSLIGVVFLWLIFIVLVQKLGWGVGVWCFIVGLYTAVMWVDFGRKDFKWKIGVIVFYTISFALIFLWLPVIIDVEKGKQPNFLVQAGLKQVKLGGGIPVNIRSGKQSIIEGKLIFYDGKKAWVQECVPKSIVANQGAQQNTESGKGAQSESRNKKVSKQTLEEHDKRNKQKASVNSIDKPSDAVEQKVITEVVVTGITYFENGYDICQKASGVQAKQAKK